MEKLIGSIIAIVVIGLIGLGVKSVTGYYDDHVKTCTVTGKDRVWKSDGEGSGSSSMRVYTEECGTLEVGDSLVKGKFNSADTFGKLKEGHRYELKYHGWRIGWLSAFPTITEVKEV
jgi:hypothetical protein